MAPWCLFFKQIIQSRDRLWPKKCPRIRYNAKLRSLADARPPSESSVRHRWPGRPRLKPPSFHYCCPPTMSLFSAVELAPRDPILGLNEAFNADARTTKVNLGVGVYFNEEGKIPLLRAVREAEKARVEAALPRGYLPIEGIAAYDAAVQKLLLGNDSPLIAAGRVVTAQALGGTGALKIGADFLKRVNPNVKVAISDPSWENHRALFESAGFEVVNYPYYDAHTHGVNFEGMLNALNSYAAGTVVVLHACCHNPTGVDLTVDQWKQIVKARNLVPFLDIAYQGFGDNIESDAAAVRLFAASELNVFVSSSFSKSFSLYGERIGALSIITASKEESVRVLSQLKRVIRTNYSNPPTHGGSVVAAVLASPELRATWETELAEMRDRIRAMRNGLVERLKASGVDRDFSFVNAQRGMFSYSGLTAPQVDRLREEFGIYAVSTGRICVAALNTRNLDVVASAIAHVLK
jgi:aromatic-amino-acid transaminase